MNADPTRRIRAGAFTLLELVLALAVFLIVAAGAVGLVEASLRIGTETVEAQNRRLEKTATHSFLKMLIDRVPGNSEFSLEADDDGGSPYLVLRALPPDVLRGVPGGGSGNLLIHTQDGLGGYTRLTVTALTKDESSDFPNALPQDRRRALMLLDQVSDLRLRLFDPALREWVTTWDTGRRPTLCEVTLGIDRDAAQRFVFSIPPAAAPQGGATPPSGSGTPRGAPGSGTPAPPGSAPALSQPPGQAPQRSLPPPPEAGGTAR